MISTRDNQWEHTQFSKLCVQLGSSWVDFAKLASVCNHHRLRQGASFLAIRSGTASAGHTFYHRGAARTPSKQANARRGFLPGLRIAPRARMPMTIRVSSMHRGYADAFAIPPGDDRQDTGHAGARGALTDAGAAVERRCRRPVGRNRAGCGPCRLPREADTPS